ncbi:MAG: hypothetical protein SGJ15_02380 [Bacteroidota bacterium]|nr:hypothetical protein [Bacteroidota bacterium]
MILKGILYIVLIIFSAVFLIVSLIMAALKFNSNGKQALRWLIGFGLSLLVLIFSIMMLVNGVVGKAKEFAGSIEEFGMEQAQRMDSLNNLYTNSKDSLLESASINYLMSLEPDSVKGKVHAQFYGYLGFRDYYRLPIVWPYSLHCMDSLGDGTLYNEANVQQFDINDNGELSCDVNGIMTFAFTKEHLIGMRVKIENKPKKVYFAYDFKGKSENFFKNEQELLYYAQEIGFDKSTELKSCKDYYNEF